MSVTVQEVKDEIAILARVLGTKICNNVSFNLKEEVDALKGET